MRIEFHPEALAEYEEAATYYAAAEEGLAERFVLTIESALRDVSTSPLRWRIFEDDVRRYLTRVFPYAILYTVEAQFLLVVAVMHCHREPGYWKHRAS
jgi:toxin ParE1/3/4